MKKNLKDITKEECKIICEMYNEPFIDFYVHEYSNFHNIIVSITTTTTLKSQSSYDSSIAIHLNGNITLTRNDGGWNGCRSEDISPLMAIDFLKSRGYVFEYELPKKLERKIKILNIKDYENI